MASRTYPFFICRTCLRHLGIPKLKPISRSIPLRHHTTTIPTSPETAFETGDFRKELKQERKARAKERHSKDKSSGENEKWIITCGLEIHAQLNTKRKLFSGFFIYF
jgi:aspartyl-tRNA(Asn)/glutamyl-tRNA(Gln) amidotransferase subunit B